MQLEKISKTIASALAYLEDSADVYAKGNETKVMQLTWKAASDLEYGLFIFSLIHQDEARSPAWKLPHIKKLEVEALIASTTALLKGAAKSLKADEFKEAYKKTWLARGQLLRIHDFFEKKQGKTREEGNTLSR